VAQADRALKLAPGTREARQIKQAAQQALADLNTAAAEAKAKLEAGDMDGASEALGRLLALDPKHPVATELSARLNSYFQRQAEDARREASRAQTQAERAQAAGAPTFAEALASVKNAETQLANGEFAVATQDFLDARDTFDRARRAAEAQSREYARQTASAPASEPERPSPQRTRSSVATVPPAPATTVAAAAPPEPATKSISLLAPRKPFVAGGTVIHSAPGKKGPAGFDTEDVNVNPEFRCQIRFEAAPPAVRPGEDYSVKIFMINKGEKTLRIRDVTLTTTVDGSRSTRPASPETKEVSAGDAAGLAEVSGAIDEGVSSWALEAVVSSPKGDVCSNHLTWK
jgi:tetratricopeptide (TPR) repeat protein